MQTRIFYNEFGRRIGESSTKAKLTDHEVDLVIDLLDAGLSYAKIATKFDVSKSCVQKIANGSCRSQTIFRVVSIKT